MRELERGINLGIEKFCEQFKEIVAEKSRLRTDNITKDLVLCNDTEELYKDIDLLSKTIREELIKND